MKSMKPGLVKKYVGLLLSAMFLVSPVLMSNANAAATQADIDYSQQVSSLSQEFVDVLNAWALATANPPAFAIGKKFNAYKSKAVKSSDAVLATLKKMKALQASEGFATSGPMLTKAATSYFSAINSIKNAINKNDSKLMKKANTAVLKAGTLYSNWSEAYAKDVAALNG